MKTQTRYDFSKFKRNINLATFAAIYGYEIDRRKTTKTSIAMKSSNDKVIISKRGGIWVYFSVFDEQDSGTIIDFVAHRSNKSIPEIGTLLSDWSGLGAVSLPTYNIVNQTHDSNRVQSIFNKCRPVGRHEYLESRGLGANLLTDDRFSGRVFSDRYGNAAFPHYHKNGICGLELKNATRGLLVKGSQKTFWRSNSRATDTRLVIAEAVIDALSYQQLFQCTDAIFIATGGGVSANQCQLLSDMLNINPQLKTVVIATDNDSGGDRIAKRIIDQLMGSEFSGKLSRHRPLHPGEDWNDALRRSG